MYLISRRNATKMWHTWPRPGPGGRPSSLRCRRIATAAGGRHPRNEVPQPARVGLLPDVGQLDIRICPDLPAQVAPTLAEAVILAEEPASMHEGGKEIGTPWCRSANGRSRSVSVRRSMVSRSPAKHAGQHWLARCCWSFLDHQIHCLTIFAAGEQFQLSRTNYFSAEVTAIREHVVSAVAQLE